MTRPEERGPSQERPQASEKPVIEALRNNRRQFLKTAGLLTGGALAYQKPMLQKAAAEGSMDLTPTGDPLRFAQVPPTGPPLTADAPITVNADNAIEAIENIVTILNDDGNITVTKATLLTHLAAARTAYGLADAAGTIAALENAKAELLNFGNLYNAAAGVLRFEEVIHWVHLVLTLIEFLIALTVDDIIGWGYQLSVDKIVLIIIEIQIWVVCIAIVQITVTVVLICVRVFIVIICIFFWCVYDANRGIIACGIFVSIWILCIVMCFAVYLVQISVIYICMVNFRTKIIIIDP